MARTRTKSVIRDGKKFHIFTCECGNKFETRDYDRKICWDCKPKQEKAPTHYTVVYDPCDAPFEKGAVLTKTQVIYGLRYRSFEIGMIFEHRGEKFVVAGRWLKKWRGE